ncbi:hypothetical protein [Nocardia mexicana]|nr:hypothetical protein [Nocardia mexicana]
MTRRATVAHSRGTLGFGHSPGPRHPPGEQRTTALLLACDGPTGANAV